MGHAQRKSGTMNTTKAKEPDPQAKPRRTGFLDGQFTIPDDFDRMAEHEIAALFEADGPHA